MSIEFWQYLQKLVDTSKIVLDRPKGATHPRFAGLTYPVDYGYLEGTSAIDAGGVDIWVGTLGKKRVVGVLCTVDLLKRDTELKIIYDCSEEEIKQIVKLVNHGDMRGYYLKRQVE